MKKESKQESFKILLIFICSNSRIPYLKIVNYHNYDLSKLDQDSINDHTILFFVKHHISEKTHWYYLSHIDFFEYFPVMVEPT